MPAMVGEVVRWGGALLGVALVVATAANLVNTLVVPRGRATGLSQRVAVVVAAGLHLLAGRARSYTTKDRLLAQAGPLAVLGVLGAWLTLFALGYTLVLWPLTDVTFGQAFREIGSSLFTLGFASQPTAAATAVDFAAAATGLLAVALQISYLPVLYGAFSRREVLVTMLQSRAGSPAWGPEILARHQLVGIIDNLRAFYGDWEAWAAEVAESHANYPVLLRFRSPHPLRSWVIALLAVLDSAALYHALAGDAAPSETRLCLRQGFTALRDIADVVGVPYDPDPSPDAPLRLSYDEFLVGVARLEAVGFPMERSPEDAWQHFRGWRNNYEALAYGLAELIAAPPAPWSGARRRLSGVVIAPQRPIDRRPGGDVRTFDLPPMPSD